MSTAFWIKIGLDIFFRWLAKQKQDDGKNSVLVNNLIGAQSIDDLMNIATDETTEEAVAEILVEAAEVPVGRFLDRVVRKLARK
jgi:hypothetical protein